MATNHIPTASVVNALVAKWTARHPELAERLERASALVANVTTTLDPDIFSVEGSYEHRYLVRVNRQARTSTCTCPDSEKGHHCKHRLAVALIESGKA